MKALEEEAIFQEEKACGTHLIENKNSDYAP